MLDTGGGEGGTWSGLCQNHCARCPVLTPSRWSQVFTTCHLTFLPGQVAGPLTSRLCVSASRGATFVSQGAPRILGQGEGDGEKGQEERP